jgi:hypothetical protein
MTGRGRGSEELTTPHKRAKRYEPGAPVIEWMVMQESRPFWRLTEIGGAPARARERAPWALWTGLARLAGFFCDWASARMVQVCPGWRVERRGIATGRLLQS